MMNTNDASTAELRNSLECARAERTRLAAAIDKAIVDLGEGELRTTIIRDLTIALPKQTESSLR